MAIDYGQKRVGVAVTDPLQLIATKLDTVPSGRIWDFLADYFGREEVERLVVGYPRQMNNEPSDSVRFIDPFIVRFRKLYPAMPVELEDERFTSKIAFQTMIAGGLKKKARQNKAMVDAVSAVIILQSYMSRTKM
jgi:putative Holliday junction resolvase